MWCEGKEAQIEKKVGNEYGQGKGEVRSDRSVKRGIWEWSEKWVVKQYLK